MWCRRIIEVMDESFELKNVKKIKFRKKQNAIKSRNGIDNLPDAILEHILSYLSTKDAVRTSILSKRWQYLWTSIPKLEFYEEESDRRMMLMNFVERALALRDSSNIKDFSVSCDVECETYRINSWISAVVKHKVQVLYLGLANFQESLELTPSLFTCESLKELTLSMFHYLELPSSVSFPSLKKLILIEVIFPDDNSTQQLFSGCPILEELVIIDCIWNNVKAVCISPPMLRFLYISDANENKDDLNADADGQNESNSCQVKIFGNSLESFSFSGDHLNDFCFLNSSSVVDASIEVFQRDDDDFYVDVQDAHRIYKLLDGLGNVEKLKLQVSSLEVCSQLLITCVNESLCSKDSFYLFTY